MYSGARREDPADLPCFKACTACYRCSDKGKYAKCSGCSGRHDPKLRRDPYDDRDQCRCSEGILQIRMKNGKLAQYKYPHNPFAGNIQSESRTKDEEEYDDYVNMMREKLDDPYYDPVQITEE